MYDVPLYPTNNYPLYEATANNDKVKLKNVTWCMGDKPCKTIRKAAGCWTETTRWTGTHPLDFSRIVCHTNSMINEPTTLDLDALELEDIYPDLEADSYADAIMADLGLSSDAALFGIIN